MVLCRLLRCGLTMLLTHAETPVWQTDGYEQRLLSRTKSGSLIFFYNKSLLFAKCSVFHPTSRSTGDLFLNFKKTDIP